MFRSLKSKILVPSIGILILLVAILIVYTAVSVNNFADEFTQQRLETAILTTDAYMDSIAERNRTTSLAVAQNPMVIEYL